MSIKRVDVEEDQDTEIGWSWMNCNGSLKKILIHDKDWIRLYVKDELIHVIHRTELKHLIKALQNAEKWCSVLEEN